MECNALPNAIKTSGIEKQIDATFELRPGWLAATPWLKQPPASQFLFLNNIKDPFVPLAKVIDIGEDVMILKEGETIFYDNAACPLSECGDDILLMRETDVMAKINDYNFILEAAMENNLLEPLHDYVLIEPATMQEETESGIFIPESARQKPNMGKVMAVGRGTYENGQLNPTHCKVGWFCIYARHAGQEIEHDNKKYVLIRDDSVFLKVNKQE